jgi:transposase
MGMADHSLDLKRRLVEAYRAGKSGTYATTAALFGVGEASVSRLLRRHRETGDVQQKPRGGNNPRKVDLAWVQRRLEAAPDERLIDRVDAWEQESGVRVGLTAMWNAVRDCGWTHKKRPKSPARPTGQTSVQNAKPSSTSSRISIRRS